MFIYNSYANNNKKALNRKLHRSLHQVHFKRLHNDTGALLTAKGIGMITYIWNLSENRTVPIRVLTHPYARYN